MILVSFHRTFIFFRPKLSLDTTPVVILAAVRNSSSELDLLADKDAKKKKKSGNVTPEGEVVAGAESNKGAKFTRHYIQVNSRSMSNEEIDDTANTLKTNIRMQMSNLADLLDQDPQLLDVCLLFFFPPPPRVET